MKHRSRGPPRPRRSPTLYAAIEASQLQEITCNE